MNVDYSSMTKADENFWAWFSSPASLLGGIIIGIAASLLYFGSGRIAGISGIAGKFFGQFIPFPRHLQESFRAGEWTWRLLFLIGLVSGGAFLLAFLPEYAPKHHSASPGILIAAGLLVGIGTRLGLGCTSGHGVCGIGRMSVRSIFSTMIFMAAGFVTVAIIRSIDP